jgi:uncharacterized membrane protein YfcA
MARIRWVLVALAVAAAVGGIGGYFVAGHLPYLGLIGFLGVLALLVLFAFSRPAEPPLADDLRRAGKHRDRHMPEGPAPPGPI